MRYRLLFDYIQFFAPLLISIMSLFLSFFVFKRQQKQIKIAHYRLYIDRIVSLRDCSDVEWLFDKLIDSKRDGSKFPSEVEVTKHSSDKTTYRISGHSIADLVSAWLSRSVLRAEFSTSTSRRQRQAVRKVLRAMKYAAQASACSEASLDEIKDALGEQVEQLYFIARTFLHRYRDASKDKQVAIVLPENLDDSDEISSRIFEYPAIETNYSIESIKESHM